MSEPKRVLLSEHDSDWVIAVLDLWPMVDLLCAGECQPPKFIYTTWYPMPFDEVPRDDYDVSILLTLDSRDCIRTTIQCRTLEEFCALNFSYLRAVSNAP